MRGARSSSEHQKPHKRCKILVRASRMILTRVARASSDHQKPHKRCKIKSWSWDPSERLYVKNGIFISVLPPEFISRKCFLLLGIV
jgi:hypothetical protein